MALEFGVFDHIEHLPGVALEQLYDERLQQLALFDQYGFYSYHLAEHHTPAVHSMAPSQNVFLASAAQRTTRLRFGPCVYVMPLHHPLRLIEEISMLGHLLTLNNPVRVAEELGLLDNLTNGRLVIGFLRGTPNEDQTYSVNPTEGRELLREHRHTLLPGTQHTHSERYSGAPAHPDAETSSTTPSGPAHFTS